MSEISVSEAAKRLKLSKRRVLQIVRDGRLPVVRTVDLGGMKVFMLDSAQVAAFGKRKRPPGNTTGLPRKKREGTR